MCLLHSALFLSLFLCAFRVPAVFRSLSLSLSLSLSQCACIIPIIELVVAVASCALELVVVLVLSDVCQCRLKCSSSTAMASPTKVVALVTGWLEPSRPTHDDILSHGCPWRQQTTTFHRLRETTAAAYPSQVTTHHHVVRWRKYHARCRLILLMGYQAIWMAESEESEAPPSEEYHTDGSENGVWI